MLISIDSESLSILLRDHGEMRLRISGYSQRCTDYEVKIGELNEEIGTLTLHKQDLIEQLNYKESVIANLREKNTNQSNSLEAVIANLREKKVTVEHYKKDTSCLDECARLRKENDELKTKLSNLEAHYAEK